MTVKSALHALIEELNKPHLHAEVDAPEEETTEENADAKE